MSNNVYGIDLGTNNFKVYSKATGKTMLEKNTIAVIDKNQIYAYGDSAYAMYEKAPETINVIFPVVEGVIADYNLLQTMIFDFLEHKTKARIKNAEFIIAVPTDITDVEKRAFYELFYKSKSKPKKVMLCEKPIADAVGLGIDVNEPTGVMIVDMGEMCIRDRDIYELLLSSIEDEPPISQRDGDIIKAGYNEEVDRLRDAKTKGKTWLAELEAGEREKTGIKNLRIKYNKVFGYYLEVTNSFKDMVPDYYVRKQTLTNAERYITPELKELEDTILGAEDRLTSLEYELFRDVRKQISCNVSRIQKTARAIAQIDVFASLALVASQNNYCKPKINESGIIDIKNGRHPVVEKMITNDMFIENETYLDQHKNRISIITGPNMAGKSTYMRQTALIVLMAQIGSFVPAQTANIGIVDRIFTRVGASDDLASGQSTFMVEMNEVANILRNATAKSLLILDEIGRGTSTFDGLSIAWAVVEHISNPKLLGAKTLFATHYHELTELEGKLDSVNNYCIAVKEKGDDIVFLRKIVKGGADRSYGIQVAKLAGLPDSVIERAKEIAEQLLANDITDTVKSISVDNGHKHKKEHLDEVDMTQISLFDTVKDDDIIDELRSIDIGNMTPLDALNKLYQLQNKVKNRW